MQGGLGGQLRDTSLLNSKSELPASPAAKQ